ncbi:MAG TPA: GNAT family protein [Anaerolineales bacterium]
MIVGKRVRLRAVERADIALYHEWLNDAEVTEGLARYLPFSMADEERWFENMSQREEEQRPLAIEILDGQEWKLAGNTGLFNLEWTNRSAELGIFIGDKSKWNQGYGTEALGLILQHGFNTLNLNRIFLRVYASNSRAQRSYEKAGFKLEGTMRQALFRHGQYVDVNIMSILRSEWKELPEGK